MRHLATTLAVTLAAASLARTPMRRETELRFEVDATFQRDGGVQYFYELAPQEPSPETANATFAFFRGFDVRGRWKSAEPLHVVMSRIVYEVDKDVSFFTEARAHDLAYINAVAPEAEVSRLPDGGYRAARMPSNVFSISWLDGAKLDDPTWSVGLSRMASLAPDAGPPASVVVQENTDFARVMGVRTGEASLTWSSHHALGPGRTRITVYTMSYLHSVPPFFLGGEKRVLDESVEGARDLIERLRAYRRPGADQPKDGARRK